MLNLKDSSINLPKLLAEWEYFYNHKRLHSALEGKTPWEKFKELATQTPIQPDVTQMYWDSNEHILPRSSAYLKWKKKMSHFC